MSTKFRLLIASRSLGVGLLLLALVIAGCEGGKGSSTGPTDPNPGGSYLDRSWSVTSSETAVCASDSTKISIKSATPSVFAFWRPSLTPASGVLVTFTATQGTFDSPSGRTDSAGNFSTKYRTSPTDQGLVEMKVYVEGVDRYGSALFNVGEC